MYETYIKRCFELAKLGESLAYPNPIVGAVIVHNDEIIGEGFHRCAGEPHAEVNAVNSVIAKYPENFTELLKKSEIYVSLEPCTHTGKTPPCTDLIKKYQFKKLIFALRDKNPKVLENNSVYKQIKANGTEIIYPEELAEDISTEAKFLNRKFLKQINHKNNFEKSWITLKVASYPDGSMISKPETKWITNSESRKEVHRLRACHDTIITGINSIKNDNSRLNIRFTPNEINLNDYRSPEIIILKSKQDFTDLERSNLAVFENESVKEFKISMNSSKAENNNVQDLKSLLIELSKEKPKRFFIEAGPKLVKAFLTENLVDEIIHFEPKLDEIKEEEQIKNIIDRYSKLITVNRSDLPLTESNNKTNIHINKKSLFEYENQIDLCLNLKYV